VKIIIINSSSSIIYLPIDTFKTCTLNLSREQDAAQGTCALTDLGHRSKKASLVLFAGGMLSIERESCIDDISKRCRGTSRNRYINVDLKLTKYCKSGFPHIPQLLSVAKLGTALIFELY